MNYQEAKILKEKYKELVGADYSLIQKGNKILALVIAPSTIEYSAWANLVTSSVRGNYDNDEALKKASYLDEDLNVYVITMNGLTVYHIPLNDYLLEVGTG